jgi:hypothetical protein
LDWNLDVAENQSLMRHWTFMMRDGSCQGCKTGVKVMFVGANVVIDTVIQK